MTPTFSRHAIALGLGLAAAFAAVAEEPRKLAIVDTGNTGRSVTAEALAQAYIGVNNLHVAVISRGIDVDPFDVEPEVNVVTLLRQRGISVTGHRAAQLTPGDVRHADVVVTLTQKHKARVLEMAPDAKAKVFTISEYATGTHTDVDDAWGKPMDFYVNMVKQVEGYIPAAINKLAKAEKK